MSALTVLSIAYPCVCLGFCLGFVVSAFFRGAQAISQDAPE